MPTAPFELAVAPLDVVRRAALQLVTRSRVLARVVGRRDSRVALLATIQVTILFLFAVRFPVGLFFVGPIVFGVIHLAADVRYLALRRSPPRLLLGASVVLAVTLTAVRAAAGFHLLRAAVTDQIDISLGVLWVGLALALALRDERRKAALVAPAFVLGAAYVLSHAHAVGLALIHLHNVIALGAWLVLFRRRASWTAIPLALIGAGVALLLSGVTLPWTYLHGGSVAFGMHAERLAMWIAPGVAPELAVAILGTFVFMQGVHYAAWTGWIPQDALRGEGTPSYRQTVRGLTHDFGPVAFGVIVAVAVGLVGLALWDVRQSVAWYMNLSKSHAWFECAFLGYFLVRGDFRPAAAS